MPANPRDNSRSRDTAGQAWKNISWDREGTGQRGTGGNLRTMKGKKIQGFWDLVVACGLTLVAVVSPGMMGGSGALHAQHVVVLDTPDLDKTQHALERASDEEGRDKVGIVLPWAADVLDMADHTITSEGEMWTLRIQAPGAEAMSVYFDAFYLPVGAELFFETPRGAFEDIWVEGPVTSFENNAHGRWTNDEVPGDDMVIRLTLPHGAVEMPVLHTAGMGFFARHTHFLPPFDSHLERGGAEACQVDVMCPEGDSWQCDRDAVVKLRITQNGGIYFCSGSMVNNVEQDCRQLMLSSFHCADGVQDDEWPYFKVQFNYEFSSCGGTSSINSRTRTGVIHLTDSDDMVGGQIDGSDFLLVEVEDPIDSAWHPYFAGWDATGFNGHSGVGIHHPSGDRKKISTYGAQLTTSGVYAPGAHWRVTWMSTQTNHGVTETGSSGSPIFNENHHIVGTLSGGSSFCANPSGADYYGKLSYHWSGNNPIPDNMKLAAFLDPNGTGQEVQHGSYMVPNEDGTLRCDAFSSCEATNVEHELLRGLVVSPNPAKDVVVVSLPSGFSIAGLRVYDGLGRLQETVDVSGQPRAWNLDVSSWESGIHYLTLTTVQGWVVTRKVVVQ